MSTCKQLKCHVQMSLNLSVSNCPSDPYTEQFSTTMNQVTRQSAAPIMTGNSNSRSTSGGPLPYTTELKLGGPWRWTDPRHGEPDVKLARASDNDADTGYVNIRPSTSGYTIQSTQTHMSSENSLQTANYLFDMLNNFWIKLNVDNAKLIFVLKNRSLFC